MAHGRQRVDIHQEIKAKLQSMERFGESRHEAKIDNRAKDGIYSFDTATTYNKECQQFAEYVREVSPQGRYTSLNDCFGYAKDYIARNNANLKYSADTVQLERSALAKLFGVEAKELGEVRAKQRSEIKRSRQRTVVSNKTGKTIKNPSTRAGRFSEKNHANEVAFARGTGMRRAEMSSVRGDQFMEGRDGKCYFMMDGSECKGGRARKIPVLEEHKEVIKELAQRSGNNKIFEKVPAHMDVHHYRSQYATTLYNKLAREKDQIPKEDRYYCRRDLKGVWYDRNAMKIVSEALGHNRISVIASHYLR